MHRHVHAFRFKETDANIRETVLSMYCKLVEFEKQFNDKKTAIEFDTQKEVAIMAECLEMVFILYEDRNPIGVLGSDSINNGCLSMLYIEEGYRHTGAGHRLVHALKICVPNKVHVFCIENNEPAIAFYEKEGFIMEKQGNGGVICGEHPNN